MKLESRATSWRDSRAVGTFFVDLIRDPSWVLRRVEGIRLLDENNIERQVSVDIDVDVLKSRMREAGLARGAHVYVPLFTQRKTLMLDLDIRNAEGAAIPLATSAQDSWVGYAMLLSVLEENGIAPTSLSSQMREELYRFVRRFPGTDEAVALAEYEQTGQMLTYWSMQGVALFSDNRERDLWTALFAIDAFERLATELLLKSVAVVPVQLGTARTVVLKYRHVNAGALVAIPGGGLGVFLVVLPLDSVGTSQREHFQFEVPEGLQVASVQLVGSVLDGAPNGEIAYSPFTYQRRASTDRAIIYTRRAPKGNYQVMVGLQSRPSDFAGPALFSVALSAVLLGIFAGLQILHSLVPDVEGALGAIDVDALTTTLPLVPTLLSLFLVRPREHSIVARLLVRFRVLVLISAFCMVVSASALGLGLKGWLLALIFASCFGICVVVLMVLGQGFLRMRRTNRRVRERASNVDTVNLLLVPETD